VGGRADIGWQPNAADAAKAASTLAGWQASLPSIYAGIPEGPMRDAAQTYMQDLSAQMEASIKATVDPHVLPDIEAMFRGFDKGIGVDVKPGTGSESLFSRFGGFNWGGE
jgi:hypothetical protein